MAWKERKKEVEKNEDVEGKKDKLEELFIGWEERGKERNKKGIKKKERKEETEREKERKKK